MELPNESVPTETEGELIAVGDAFKKEPSILDEILTVESAESSSRSEGDTNTGQREHKEVMVSQVRNIFAATVIRIILIGQF